MQTFMKYGAYFAIVFLFMFFDKLSIMAGGLFVLAGLINIGLKYGLWLNLFVNRVLLRIQNDEEYAERIKGGLTSFGFWTIDAFTMIPAILYLLLLGLFPMWWYTNNPGVAIPSGLEDGVAFLPINAFLVVFLEFVLHLLVPVIKWTGANISTTEVAYASAATMHTYVILGVALSFFVFWAFTTWDDRIKVMNDVPVNSRGQEAGWQSWVNWFFRNLLIRLGIPLIIAMLSLKTGVWDKTIVPIKKNDAAVVVHEMLGFHTPEYEQLIQQLRKQKMPDTPLGNEVAELANPTAPAPVTYNNPTKTTPTYTPTYTPSGSKSKSGGGMGWMVWVIILVLVGGLLFWLKKKGKLPAIKKPSFSFKMPSFRRKKGSGEPATVTQEQAIEAAQRLEHPAGLDPAAIAADIEIIEAFLIANRDTLREEYAGILDQVIANARPYAQGGGAPVAEEVAPDIAEMQAVVTKLQLALRGGMDVAEVQQNIAFIEMNAVHFPQSAAMLANLVAGVRKEYPQLDQQPV